MEQDITAQNVLLYFSEILVFQASGTFVSFKLC